jgi:acetyl-CoA carboxylase carboxyl transferase subunit alpha
MKTTFLDFEQPIAELENRIEELRYVQDDSALDISQEIERLAKKSQALTKEIYAKLTPWQVAQVARHPQRPYTLDYVQMLFSGFEELHGDRVYGDDQSIVGGLARFDGESCVVIGHQKGRDTKEKIVRNFGMPRPEGYRKALRLMMLAEKFSLPVFTFVDTPGRVSGDRRRGARAVGAIGRNLFAMAQLKTPVVVTIIGEGGSGGALAIAIGDIVMMMQYATYSVISPEGCASILWKSAEKAPEAAESLGITASRLKTLGLVDRIVNEPLGGAHRDPQAACGRAEEGARRSAAAGAGKEAEAARRGAPRAPDELWQVQGSDRALNARCARSCARTICAASASLSASRAESIRSSCFICCASLRPNTAFSVSAIHVHHGLSPNATHGPGSAARFAGAGKPRLRSGAFA